MLPTISRSLCQSEETAKARSKSLKKKLSALAARLPTLQPSVHIQKQVSAGVLGCINSPSSIAPHLWLHLQKYTPCKTATLLQSFIATGIQPTPLPEDMLEEPWQATKDTCRSRPSPTRPDEGGASDADYGLEGCPAATAACDGPSSEWHLLRAVAISESFLEADDDELLLGAECFEDANLFAFRGSEVS